MRHARTVHLELTTAKLGVTLVSLARLARLAGTAALKFQVRFQTKICVPCELGKYNEHTKQLICRACAIGYYNEE